MSGHPPARKRPRSFLLRRGRDTRPPAQTPGTGGYVGERRVDAVAIRVLDYGPEGVREREVADGRECAAFEGRDGPAWVQVTGLHEAERLRGLLEAYRVHPLVWDDIMNTNQSPKVEDFGDYLFITARLLTRAPEDSPERFEMLHFAMILTDRVLLSFQEAPAPLVFDPVRTRLIEGRGLLRSRGPDYLAWALLDAALDHYIRALDDLGDEVSALDERLTLPGSSVGLDEIHALRARTSFLYRAIRPMREVAVSLQRSESPLVTPGVHPFIRDLYDHAWHAIEAADHLREAAAAIREYHQALLGQRLNEVMKALTAISTVFLPLSFLAGVYGMNFDFMPELHQPWAYPALWAVFFVIGCAMTLYFRGRRWL